MTSSPLETIFNADGTFSRPVGTESWLHVASICDGPGALYATIIFFSKDDNKFHWHARAWGGTDWSEASLKPELLPSGTRRDLTDFLIANTPSAGDAYEREEVLRASSAVQKFDAWSR